MRTEVGTRPGECAEEGYPLAWKRRCIEYAVEQGGVDSLGHDAVIGILSTSTAAWTDLLCDGQSPGFDVVLHAEPSTCDFATYNQDGPNMNIIGFVSDWEARGAGYDPNAYALTTVWHSLSTGEIVDVDMEINEDRGNPYTVCPAEAGCTDGRSVDLQNVVTHEMGHFLGLGHTTDATATMYGAASPGEVAKRSLETDDTAGFCAIYPPGSLRAECDYTPNGGATLECTVPQDDSCFCAFPGASSRKTKVTWWLIVLVLGATLSRRRARARRAECAGCEPDSRA